MPPKRPAVLALHSEIREDTAQKREALETIVTCREVPHSSDHMWEAGRRCFLFVSDSQVVVNILTGRVPLLDNSFRPAFQRISERVSSIVFTGWQPPRTWDDPFQWRPRRFNVRADAVCNAVLDTGREIEFMTPDMKAIEGYSPNFLVYSDGGCRYQGIAAYSWIIYAVVPCGLEWRTMTVAIVGKRLERNASSFITETLALDGATEMLHRMLCTTSRAR